MTRVKSPRKRKRRSIFRLNIGYRKPANNSFKIANQRFLKAQVHTFRDRHKKKQVFRHLWIARINAFSRKLFEINYSTLISQLKKAKILTNRKIMAQLAIYDFFVFESFIKFMD